MKDKEILNFNEFESKFTPIFESDKDSKNITLVYQIMSALYNVYGALLPLADGYDRIIDDIKEIASEGEVTKEDPTGKSEAMRSMIDAVIEKVAPEYKGITKDFKEASELIIGSYITLLGKFDEGEDKEIRDIVNAVSKSAVDFTVNLEKSKKEVREEENHSAYESFLFESRNRKERNEILQSIVVAKAIAKNNLEIGGLESIRGTFKGYLDELEEFAEKVNKENDDYWKGKKRKERLKEIEEISNRVNEIPEEIGAVIAKYARKLGANSDSVQKLEDGIELFDSAMEKLKNISNKEIQKETTPEEEKKAADEMGIDSKGSDKGDKEKEYKNIDPEDNENSRKSGENRDTIRDYQEKVNKIMELDTNYKKIKTDGLYGDNTKRAFKELQLLLNKLGAGLNTKGNLSSQMQKTMDSFIENKEEIGKLLKNKS